MRAALAAERNADRVVSELPVFARLEQITLTDADLDLAAPMAQQAFRD
jgi:hypothetical protein